MNLALLATPPYAGRRQMTVPAQNDDSPIQIPSEAERAFRRATGHTLTSFAFLRKALREHVESERKESSLLEIEVELRALVARARLELPVASANAGSQDNLSEHLMEWTETFFRTPRDSRLSQSGVSSDSDSSG
jgi:hypothetical protein